MAFNKQEHQHVRYNPLKGEWVLVSPHRLQRPWAGQEEPADPKQTTTKQKSPLAPGAVRPNGTVNPQYTSTFVFDNDYPALLEATPEPPVTADPLFQIGPANGICRVICYTPKPQASLPYLSVMEIFNVITCMVEQTVELGKKFNWVQIFENKGAMMGASNPHPHCQVWASNFLPNEAVVKDCHMKEYYERHNRPLLMDYVRRELELQERVVLSNSEWVVVVPFWAVWPYETLLLPRKHVKRFYDLDHYQRSSLAQILKQLTIKYDNLFNTSFPYSMGWHGAPTGEYEDKPMDHWVFHGMFLPPLLRSATVKKHMVGYELLAQVQRDLTPETAAGQLRVLPDHHHRERSAKANPPKGELKT